MFAGLIPIGLELSVTVSYLCFLDKETVSEPVVAQVVHSYEL